MLISSYKWTKTVQYFVIRQVGGHS